MKMGSVFQYQSARRFLLDYVAAEKSRDPSFSMRRWAKEMGLTSHALLVMILQGKRSLTLKQVPYLSKGLKLSSPERLYFQALIQFENAQTEEEKALCQLWLSEVNPGGNFSVKEIDEYIVIAHWVHMAILAMTDLKEFTGSPEEIFLRLGKVVSIHEIRGALERLKSLDLIREENGKLVCTYKRVTSKDDIANRGAREYHKQVAALIPGVLENQSLAEREFQSFAVAVPKSKVPLAKEMIRKFRTQFYEAMTQEPGDDVYQTSIQFFRLTESPARKFSQVDAGAGSETNANQIEGVSAYV